MSRRLILSAREIAAAGGVLLLAANGCDDGRPDVEYVRVVGGEAERGKRVIADVGCGACHEIPGIRGADGTVGPPLTNWAERVYIAGSLPNVPDNLIRWVANAHSVEPDTAMPNLDLSEQDARDVAAYLYTLN